MEIKVELRGTIEEVVPVTIVQCGSMDELHGKVDYLCAPDTESQVSPFTIDRGENLHGSLSEDLFVIQDDLNRFSCYFLWMRDNGSQHDDKSRLRLLGFVRSSDLPSHDDLDEEVLAIACLLYGYVRFAMAEWGNSYFEEAEFTSHLDEPLLSLEHAWRNAGVGLPIHVGHPA